MASRVILLAASMLLALLSGRDALLAYWRTFPAAPVPAFLQDDPLLTALQADTSLLQPAGQRKVDVRQMRAAALAALQSEPLNAVAMRQLGMAAALSGEGNGQEQFALAERITRRDLLDQLLLIDTSANLGDLKNTLAHYDRLLSVYPEMGGGLYPILASAVTDEAIHVVLADYADRPWFLRLIDASIDLDAEGDAVADMLMSARVHWQVANLEPFYTRLLGRLVKDGQFSKAMALAYQMPGVRNGALEDMGFSAFTTDVRLVPLSWSLVRRNGLQAEFDGHAGLVVSVASDHFGSVAERTSLLAPGVYELHQRIAYMANSPQARLEWKIRCLGHKESMIWRQSVPRREGQVAYMSRFTVPEGCKAQRWQLLAMGDVLQMDSQAFVSRMVLVKR